MKTDGPINGSPPVVEGRTFVAGCDSILRIIDVETGKELGQVDLKGQAGASPAIAGDWLFVGNMDKTFLAIDWKQAQIKWEYTPNRAFPFYSSAAVTEKVVVVGGRDRRIHALDRQTGKELWTFQTRQRVESSPVVVGERVYCGSSDGTLYGLNLKSGAKEWEKPLGSAITASPAVAAGRLIIGTSDGLLYCFGAK